MENHKNYTRDEFNLSESIERAVLRKLRGAYELLHHVKRLADANSELLKRCNSFVPDVMEWQDRFPESFMGEAPLDQAMFALNAIGGDLYAMREMPPCPHADGQEPTDEEMDAYFELESEYRRYWLEEGRPEHICQDCQDKQNAVAEAEQIAGGKG